MADQPVPRDDPRTASNFERGGRDAHVRQDRLDEDDVTAMGGASDGSSGGGAGAGSPDADTGMNADADLRAGDPAVDREKLFPGEGKNVKH